MFGLDGLDLGLLLAGNFEIGDLLKIAEKQFGLQLVPLTMDVVPAASELRSIAQSAVRPGSQLFRLSASAKGQKVTAFVVIESAGGILLTENGKG